MAVCSQGYSLCVHGMSLASDMSLASICRQGFVLVSLTRGSCVHYTRVMILGNWP